MRSLTEYGRLGEHKSISKGITSYQPPMEREAEKDDKLLLL